MCFHVANDYNRVRREIPSARRLRVQRSSPSIGLRLTIPSGSTRAGGRGSPIAAAMVHASGRLRFGYVSGGFLTFPPRVK
jgi:hypothetical protein